MVAACQTVRAIPRQQLVCEILSPASEKLIDDPLFGCGRFAQIFRVSAQVIAGRPRQNVRELFRGGVNSTVLVKGLGFKLVIVHWLERNLQELVKLRVSNDCFERLPDARRRLRVNATALIELPVETEVRRHADCGREIIEKQGVIA
jgi:hypothetical protein